MNTNSISETNQSGESAAITSVVNDPSNYENHPGMTQTDHAPNKIDNFENEVTQRTKIFIRKYKIKLILLSISA